MSCNKSTTMAASREEVLADFQACTGIEDVAECIFHLDEANWNLLDAINRVMPQETQTLPSEQALVIPMDQTPSFLDSADTALVVEEKPQEQPTSAYKRNRLLNFSILFKDRSFPLVISDNETVGTIKTILYSEVGIPPCQQDLRGWRTKVTDEVKLSSLNLPKENVLQLIVPERPNSAETKHNGEDPTNTERMLQTFKLNITDDNSHKQYSVNYLGSKTIREVKQDVFSFTDIPVRHQIWTGWPLGITNDSATLAVSGISYPCHNLSVRKAASNDKNNFKRPAVNAGTDSSSDEFEDASESFTLEDDMFMQDLRSQRIHPLMPDGVESETAALTQFTLEFSNRYGDCHPIFFQGTLDDAIKEACLKPARERRLLAIYLHHDSSVLTNVFCTQLLCSETVVSYLSNNFITWAWDVTNEENRSNLLAMVTKHFGSMTAQTIRNFNVEQLPLLMVIMRTRGSTEVFTIIHGSVTLDELMTNLIHAVDAFTTQQKIEAREEEEREAREMVKREQDLAYEASLKADQKKEEVKRLEVEERKRKEAAAAKEREKVEILQQKEAAAKEAFRQSLEERLPSEPPEDYTGPMSRIRFRLPNNMLITRRFRAYENLQTLLDFLVVQGYHTDEYKVLSSWPRRDLTSIDPQLTLQETQLHPQETVTLERR